MKKTKDEMKRWGEELKQVHLPRWEELPSFDLYIDQVISLIQGYLYPLFPNEQESILTSAMINNYVKLKLIPKAEKKRYQRMHLAYLIAITILKQVLTISQVKEGIDYQANMSGLKEAFNLFCEEQEYSLGCVAKQVIEETQSLEMTGMNFQNTVIKMATMAFATKLVVQKTLELQAKEMQENKQVK